MSSVRAEHRVERRDDRGSGTLELVVAFPVVLLLVFTIIQAALFFHARNVALAAAQEGVRAATAYGGTSSIGVGVARDFLTGPGDGALQRSRVTRDTGKQQVIVTVSGTTPAIVPGLLLPVSQTASGPVERFTAE
jgi:Flp pilus assembly protein TadG